MTLGGLVQEAARTSPPPPPRRRTAPLTGLVRTARPRQWTKNALVLAVPLAAARMEPGILLAAGAAFAAFCLAASAVYFLNDLLDVEADRRHPDKRTRPIAAGTVPTPLAWTAGAVCAVAAVALAALATNAATAVIVGGYLLVNVAYCLRLKHIVVVDLAVVASGFLLRALAGGVAAGLPISRWFLLVAGFGSLFVVAGKRYSELVVVGQETGSRRSLAGYSASYLRFVWGTAAAVTLTAYCLWASETPPAGGLEVPWQQLSIAPFTLSMLSYAYVIDSGRAGKPEDAVLGTPALPLLGLCWLTLVALGAMHV
ncbi:decaprenyl-phosphate phosphoribosyltransferase [Actinomadura hibisca]|uniref:decaprenyl-phosphate phosphoribosyltransferase n=1 Tax=Actinomadura hibisca TaxID=68565 RepID=UPI00082F7614|nr:decaprenyl-phosphate phosphoribosyltransferase [Actinomadura hibisca]